MPTFEYCDEVMTLSEGITQDMEEQGMVPVLIFSINKDGLSKFRIEGRYIHDPKFQWWLINCLENQLARMKEGFSYLGRKQ